MNLASQPADPTLSLPIPDELVLWRRIPPVWVVEETDSNGTLHLRPSSQSFTDSKDGSSMSLYDSESCGGLDRILDGHADFGIVSIAAGQLKACGLTLLRTAIGGPGHCEAQGKKTQSVRRSLARNAEWVIKPTSQS